MEMIEKRSPRWKRALLDTEVDTVGVIEEGRLFLSETVLAKDRR